MKKSGFTLVELIVVIVILGILAVTAAPRFIDFQSDAQKAALQGVRSALEGGAKLVYAKAAIAHIQKSDDDNMQINGRTVYTVYGYPAIRDVVTNLSAWANIDGSGSGNNTDFRIGVLTDSAPQAVTQNNQFAILPSGVGSMEECKVIYEEAPEGGKPTITVLDDDC